MPAESKSTANPPDDRNYPECQRFAAIRSDWCRIEEFLDFCELRGVFFDGRAALLYQFFDIDPVKLEADRRRILASVRSKIR